MSETQAVDKTGSGPAPIPVPRRELQSVLPEHDLYQALSVKYGPKAYRYYQSMMRRLVSLEQALEKQKAH